jgi:hypothetical protein
MGNFDDTPKKAPFSMVFDPGVPQVQMPYRYQVLVERAKLYPCCYWREPEDGRTLEEKIEQDGTDNASSATPYIYEFTQIELPIGTLDGPVRTNEERIASERITAAEVNITEPVTVVGGWSHEAQPTFYMKPLTMELVFINGASSVSTRCVKAGAEVWNQGQDGFPPCNGSKTECPFYTGPKFKYLNDEDIYIGRKY